MKKAVSIILSLILVISVCSVSFTAYAEGWLPYAQKVKLNTVFSESGSVTDYHVDGTVYYYDIFKFSVPAKGKIVFRVESEESICYRGAICNIVFTLYDSKNVDEKIWTGDPYNTSYSQYSSARGVYINEWTLTLPKSTYYLKAGYDEDGMDFNCDYLLSYKPTFANTSLSSLAPKKSAFKAKWKAASGVTGYVVQYSRKSNMQSSKTIKISKSSQVSKTVSNIKSGKKYYVRVRTYKKLKVDGKYQNFYGKWSSKKSVTTK